VLGHVEGGLGGVVEDTEEAGSHQRGGGQGEECARGQDRPDEDGDPAPGHARGAVVDDGHHQVEPCSHHAQADHGEADQVRHHADRPESGGGRSRSTGREPAVEEGRQDDQVAGGEDPKAEASTRGKAVVGRRSSEVPASCQRATMTEVAIIIIIVPCSLTMAMYVPGPKMWLVGESSSVRMAMASSPPVKRKRARRPRTGGPPPCGRRYIEVLGPASRLVVRLWLHADDLGQGVVQGSDAEQPSEHAEQEPSSHGDRVGPAVGDVLVTAPHHVAQPVAEQVAQDCADDGGAQVLAEPAGACR